MTEVPHIIIPRPGEVSRPDIAEHEHWEDVCDDVYGVHDLPENIHFIHDPFWQTKFWSIQNAHDQYEFQRFGFWSLMGVIFMAMDLMWYVRVGRFR